MSKKDLKKAKEKLKDARFLLQMAGMPGSGKSSLAKRVAKASGAIVLDKDVIKSALLGGLAEEEAGPLAYKTLFCLAEDLLDRGHSVVIDSPAFYAQIIDDGKRAAEKHDAAYFVIECESPREVLAQRLADRKTPKPSQWTSLKVDDPFILPGTAPIQHPRLKLDTTEDDDVFYAKALSYLADGQS